LPLPYAQKETDEFRQVLLKTGFEEKNVKFLGRATAEDTVILLLNN
jgi:hypothetical protein